MVQHNDNSRAFSHSNEQQDDPEMTGIPLRNESGTVVALSALRRLAISPRRLDRQRGASVVRPDGRITSEVPMAKICHEAIHSPVFEDGNERASADKAVHAAGLGPPRHEAVRCDCDASLIGWHDDRRSDESNGLAAAFGPRLSGRRCAQAAASQSQFIAGRRTAGLSCNRAAGQNAVQAEQRNS